MQLDNKVVIVTGAASGIGAQIVALFLKSGARLVAVDVDPHLTEWVAELEILHQGRIRGVLGDVAEESTANAYVQEALDSFGTIDVMVNNAAVSYVKRITDHTPDEWDHVMNVNLKAIYWSACAVVPVMQTAGGGLFLNTGSISSVVGIAEQGAYAPSKGAIAQLTRQMAIDYAADNIRVNAVCPGTVDTPLLRRSATNSGNPEGFMAGLVAGHPVGRIASAEEIAHFYLYLSSDHARFFTGAVLMIDGGFTAQ